jgi:hypothetical protein
MRAQSYRHVKEMLRMFAEKPPAPKSIGAVRFRRLRAELERRKREGGGGIAFTGF